MKVLVVRDIKADAYAVPMYVASIGGCIRGFADEINKTDDNPLARHPEDYELFEIGEYDELTGKHTFLEHPKSHGVGTNYKISR